jgi:hypothetical protein
MPSPEQMMGRHSSLASPDESAARTGNEEVPAVKCPRCGSDETSLSWLHEHSIAYWCRACSGPFEVERAVVQPTAKPAPKPSGTDQPPTDQ